MQVALLVFWLFSFPLTSRCSETKGLSVSQILDKVSELYRGLQNYQFAADISSEAAEVNDTFTVGGSQTKLFSHGWDNTEVDLVAAKQGKVRMRIRGEHREILLVSDGSTKWTYLPNKKKYTEVPAAPDSPPDDSRASIEADSLLRKYQDVLVNRYRVLQNFASQFVLEKDNQIKVGKEKVDCYVLKMVSAEGVHEIWVDKERFIVWQSKDFGPTREGANRQDATTIHLKLANVNAKLEDKLFTFRPPEKAAKVETLNLSNK